MLARRLVAGAPCKMTSLKAATLVPSHGVAAGLADSGGLGVARLVSLPKCLMTARKLVAGSLLVIGPSSGKRTRPFLLLNLETGGIGCSDSCEKVSYSTLSTDLASPALLRLLSVISHFRPPSVNEFGEADLRRVLASRTIGGYSLISDDLARGSLTVFQSLRVARPQDASKAPYLGCVQAPYALSGF